MISFVSHGAGILTIMEASAEHDCCSEAQRNARRTRTSYFVCTVFLFHYIKWLPCERTLISALQALRKHHRICDTTPIKLRFTSDAAPPHTHHHSDSMGILCNVPASDVQRHPHPYLPHSSNIHHRHHKHCIHSYHNLPLYLFLSNPQSDS